MSYENIKLKYENFTIKGGYFYSFVHDNDVLYKKNTNGDVVFTYPLDTSLNNEKVLEICYDGVNFWTLQSNNISKTTVIKKWRLESYLCKFIDSYVFGSVASYHFSNSFSVEAFFSTLAEVLPFGSTYITLPDSFSRDIPVGTTITIGPNVDGFHEEVTVTGTISSNTYGLDFYTSLEHSEGESLSFVNNFWIFNAYHDTTSVSTLLRYNLISDSFDYFLEDESFNSTKGSTFYINADDRCYLLYVYGTTLRFFDIITKETTKTFTMDNVRVDESTIIPVYGLEVEGDTLYRLQNYMKYFEVNSSQATYNYQCSTLRPFVDSISMEVYPKILPSNGVSLSEVTTIIQDQYGDPAQYKAAHLSDDDATGYITITKPLTNLQGVATSYYRAGLSVREATITALATQYD